eukprot:11785049-Karenia_brevis.AAC.1
MVFLADDAVDDDEDDVGSAPEPEIPGCANIACAEQSVKEFNSQKMANTCNDDVDNCIDDRRVAPLPQPEHASPDLVDISLHENFKSQELANNYEIAE